MRKRLLIALAVGALFAIPSAVLAQGQGNCSPSLICFGRPDTGSTFFPPGEHDQSSNAKDNIVPRNVTVPVGTDVRFVVQGLHLPAIYDVGTTPDSLSTAPSAPAPNCQPPLPTIADQPGQLWQVGACVAPGTTVTAPGAIFDRPGRYLVICEIQPHFLTGMYGWVTVR